MPARQASAVLDVDLKPAACVVVAGDYDRPGSCGPDEIAGGAIDVDPLVEPVLRERFAEPLSDRAEERPLPARCGGSRRWRLRRRRRGGSRPTDLDGEGHGSRRHQLDARS
jgi:hypothetical protein